MPHVILECSDNIASKLDAVSLLRETNLVLAKNLPTDLHGCRGRVVPSIEGCIGQGNPERAFVHLTVKIMAGRTKELLDQIGELLMQVLAVHVQQASAELIVQKSIEIVEISKYYYKA